MSRNDIEAIDELYSEDYVDHSLQHAQLFGIGPNREGFKQLTRVVRAGVSDIRAETDLIVAEGDYVACVVRGTGVHSGLFMGVPATGKRLDIVDYHFFRLQNGKIREHWNQYNTLEIMQQLGVVQKKNDDRAAPPGEAQPRVEH